MIIKLSLVLIFFVSLTQVLFSCAPPGFVPSQDPTNVNARCSDLILYPVSAVDQSDQYRFDYSDVSFGNTHNQGATVAITCTAGGQLATVEGYDQQRSSITAAPTIIATCTNVGGSQYTWTILGRILQFVDCRF
uniref:C6 domain-containing protein n=1 Tax=Strongyloides papillosus TaxID=174720 RepID=A0A0N5B7F6_STREA